MTLYFTNPGEIDLDASLILGVNAKINENPIGKYGSGLKYAIAVLLRTGHDITIWSGLEENIFYAKTGTTRGVEYNQVWRNDQALGFTTHLGTNWEVWQALRELKSNAQDELGEVTDDVQHIHPEEGHTVIEVTGSGIMFAWENRDKYFLSTPEIGHGPHVKIHEGSGIYLQGILVDDLPTAFAYNLNSAKLTEDRTLADVWTVTYHIVAALLDQEDTTFLRTILEADCHEWKLTWYDTLTISLPNRALLRQAAKAGTIKSQNIRSLANGLVTTEFHARPATLAEHKMIQEGYRVLAELDLDHYEVGVATSLSEGIYTTTHDGEPYLGGGVFQMGQRTVTGALLEVLLKVRGESDYEIREFILDSFIRHLEAKIGVDTASQSRIDQVADQIENSGDIENLIDPDLDIDF